MDTYRNKDESKIITLVEKKPKYKEGLYLILLHKILENAN